MGLPGDEPPADRFELTDYAVEEMPFPESQIRELERRLADSIARPDAVKPWEEIKAAALARSTFSDRKSRA